ncbi:MAG: hypothetical protein ACLFTU_09645 [Puniceicoccaceae bacterium]
MNHRKRPSTTQWRQACLALGLLLCPAFAAANAGPDERPVIGIEQKEGVRVVVQVTTGDREEGVHKGLRRVKGIADGYLAAGVPAEEIDIRAVFHGAAAAHLLTDAAWRRHKETDGGNPSTSLLEALAESPARIELCDVRRRNEGWAKSEIHPSVVLVSNAYHRLAELQLRGFAYVRL